MLSLSLSFLRALLDFFLISLKLLILCIELSIALTYSRWSLRVGPCLALEGLLEGSILIPLLALIRVVSIVGAPILLAVCTGLNEPVRP